MEDVGDKSKFSPFLSPPTLSSFQVFFWQVWQTERGHHSCCLFRSLILVTEDPSLLKGPRSPVQSLAERNRSEKAKKTLCKLGPSVLSPCSLCLETSRVPAAFSSGKHGEWSQCPHQGPAVEPAAATREPQPWRKQSDCALHWFPWQWMLCRPCLSAPGKDKDTQEKRVEMKGRRNDKAPSLKAQATNYSIWVVMILGDLGQAIPWLSTLVCSSVKRKSGPDMRPQGHFQYFKCQGSISPGQALEE